MNEFSFRDERLEYGADLRFEISYFEDNYAIRDSMNKFF